MIIGVCGFARSGKDTFAEFFNCVEPKYKRFAFADALKEMLKPVEEQLDYPEKEIMRPLYVELGRLARSIDKDFWVKKVMEKITENAIISDVRYPNEVQAILDKGGVIVYIIRPDILPANKEEENSIGEILDKYGEKLRFIPNHETLGVFKRNVELLRRNIFNAEKNIYW